MLPFLIAASALAGSTLPPPPTVTEQLRTAAVAAEYTVVSTTVRVNDGFTVTHAELAPVTQVTGSTGNLTVILPGGWVDGRYRDPGHFGVPVAAGETLFLMLHEAVGVPGYYNVAYSFTDGFFRLKETARGALMVDGAGRYVVDTPCDGGVLRATPPPPSVADEDSDEAARAPAAVVLDDLVLSDDPESLGISWDVAIAALVACGGVE
jgi:hypothetical protein